MSAAPDARFVLRQRGVLESADLALRLVRLHARLIGRLAVAVCLPGLIFTLGMRYVLGIDAWIVWLMTIVMGAWCEGPFTTLAGELAIRPVSTANDASRAFLSRMGRYVWARTASLVVQSLAAVAFLAPWLFVAPSQLFVPEVVLLERADRGVFTRAGRVVGSATGRAVRTVVFFMLVRVGTVLLADAVLRRTAGLVFDIHARVESLGAEGISPYAIVGFWMTVPLIAMLRYVAYVDLRTMREGWDVQRRFQRLAVALAEESA